MTEESVTVIRPEDAIQDHMATVNSLHCSECGYDGKSFSMTTEMSAIAFLQSGWTITVSGDDIFCPNCTRTKMLEEKDTKMIK